MNPHKIFRDELLRADNIDPSAVSETEMARFRQLPDGTEPVTFRGKKIMKMHTAKLAVAAAVLVAALLGILFFRTTARSTWAAVLEKVRNMDTCVFRIRTTETAGPRPDGYEFATDTETIVRRSDTYGAVDESYRNGELFTRYYQLFQKGECIGVCYPMEQYERRPLDEARMRELSEKHPRQMVLKILGGDYVELGKGIHEGKRTAGVELRDPQAFFDSPGDMDDFTARIWIDVQTQLPVVVDVSYVPKGSTQRTTVVMDEFRWGVPLKANLFEPNIPASFALDDEDRSYLDSTPKTASAEVFAANSQTEPYLSDFDHLPLPDLRNLMLLGVDVNVPPANVRLLSHGQIWELQDAFMATWPPFEEVRARLHQELQDKLGVDQLGVNELVATGIALRERFWELVGCFSETSYPYAYAARMVTEMAHEKDPENLAVTDQLVESICTYAVTMTWSEDPNQRVRNPLYPGLLTELRLSQFEQIRDKAARGYVPTWKDFVRVHDLAILLSSNREDYEQARLVAQWMIDQAPTAGWTYYLPWLTKMEQAYAGGQGYRTGLFMHGPDAFPAEYQFARRLFSFQGPRERRERILPVHLRHLRGW
jgi:hypothetical protein